MDVETFQSTGQHMYNYNNVQWHSLQKEYTVADPGHLEETTRRQADSPAWFTARQNRLTASTFGEVLNRKSDPNEKNVIAPV